MHRLRRILNWLGMDRAVAYTVLARGWGWIAGLLTVLTIARYLTPSEQGYYYTFANLLALQVFFEMGLAYVILQFTSHERASLHWTDEGLLDGEHQAQARLKMLAHFALRWYSVIAVLILLMVTPLGMLLFGGEPAVVRWQGPWVWFASAAALNIMLSPILALLEGLGLVPEVAGIRLKQSISGYIILWLGMLSGLRLYSLPLYSSAMFLVGTGALAIRYRRLLMQVLTYRNETVRLNWRREVWPFQWRIAVSSVSGYFIFQLFTPVLFRFAGPEEAGRMGMSISVMGAVFALGMAWVATKAAPLGTLVASGDYAGLDALWRRCTWRSVAVVAGCGFAVWAAIWQLGRVHHHLAERLLAPVPLGMLAAVTVINQVVFAQAAYLRAHKEEPFLIPSVVGALLTGASTYFLGRAYGAEGMMAGYLTLSVVGLPICTKVFLSRRREWQTQVGYRPTRGPKASIRTASTETQS